MKPVNLGVIGYGHRINGVVNKLIKQYNHVRIAAITDIRIDEIRKQMADRGFHDIRYYLTPEEMLSAESLDGVLIGTRCSLHTTMALKVFPHGIPLFLEKPVATTMEDLLRLKQGFEANRPPVVVSFPLRATAIAKLVKEIIDSGKIGTVEHVQAINNVPYGGVYYHDWYRDERETGGLFLQKATHDFDYINYLVGVKPVGVVAMTSKQIFKGDKPAGLKCTECEDNRTCEESKAFLPGNPRGNYCCFAEDTGNEDSGSALIRYETGMHVSYSQNFFARRKAGARGARLLGYKGTIEFDFKTGKIQVFMHHTPRVETYELEATADHFGGDSVLSENFYSLIEGKSITSGTLEDGMLSALMCLKAKQSAETGTFQEIAWDGLDVNSRVVGSAI
ncbi:MAG: oxidoreductase [Paenibacillaceae bacterium]|nr:oxidoreductase [Paenibacillaceae bacterium]